MGGNSRPTFKKRQKEMARQEKQRAKAERRMQRKQEKITLGAGGESNAADDAATDQSPAVEEQFSNPAEESQTS